ncbi:helix-turn-helix transcriptional regulator [Paenibacillus gallinarum]|uniref:WYL domain-containing protein n=1 Tax=Paenibacillus gallinarum TaxID=2762232 RepID=A0ABR8SSI3_9BACL|nr:WYL domain-containing protein [Paenibacillus gallinarum]MBD7966459.1 WYL domain-containing protein [Paenibacillus gallinarum]
MTERLIRLMRIITLVQAKPGILARELAERCETSERTIYRDMDALSAMHIPVVNMGHGRGYQFISRFALYPLNWSEEETEAFAKLADIMGEVKPLLPCAFESAYEKVMAVSLKKKTERVEWAEQFAEVIRLGKAENHWQDERDNKIIVSIIQASLSQNTIQAVYDSPIVGVEGFVNIEQSDLKLMIDPYHLVPKGHHFYVIGYCHNTERVESFRMSCFLEAEIMPQTFRRELYAQNISMKDTFSVNPGVERTLFKVRFYKEAVEKMKRSEFLVKPKYIHEPDGNMILEVMVNNSEEFMDWLLPYGPAAEILEPPYYRNQLRERLKTWLCSYQDE